MKTWWALSLVGLFGCYDTIGSPVVTDVKYDDHGRLMVTRCEVGASHWGFSYGAYEVDEKSCRFERIAPPPAASSAPQGPEH